MWFTCAIAACPERPDALAAALVRTLGEAGPRLEEGAIVSVRADGFTAFLAVCRAVA